MFSFLKYLGTPTEFQDSLKIAITGPESLISIWREDFKLTMPTYLKDSSEYSSSTMCLKF